MEGGRKQVSRTEDHWGAAQQGPYSMPVLISFGEQQCYSLGSRAFTKISLFLFLLKLLKYQTGNRTLRRALKQTTRQTQIKAFALFILYQYCRSLKLKEGGKKKTKRPKLWLDTKPRSSFCHLYQDFVETFTLKMGMIQTGLLVRFGHRPLNKFQLKQSRRTSRQKSIIWYTNQEKH